MVLLSELYEHYFRNSPPKNGPKWPKRALFEHLRGSPPTFRWSTAMKFDMIKHQMTIVL